MQPLVAHNLLLFIVLVVSYLIWIVMEVSVEIRQRKRLRANVSRQDKGSQAVLMLLIDVGNTLCALLAFTVPATAITSAREILFVIWCSHVVSVPPVRGTSLRAHRKRVDFSRPIVL